MNKNKKIQFCLMIQIVVTSYNLFSMDYQQKNEAVFINNVFRYGAGRALACDLNSRMQQAPDSRFFPSKKQQVLSPQVASSQFPFSPEKPLSRLAVLAAVHDSDGENDAKDVARSNFVITAAVPTNRKKRNAQKRKIETKQDVQSESDEAIFAEYILKARAEKRAADLNFLDNVAQGESIEKAREKVKKSYDLAYRISDAAFSKNPIIELEKIERAVQIHNDNGGIISCLMKDRLRREKKCIVCAMLEDKDKTTLLYSNLKQALHLFEKIEKLFKAGRNISYEK